jgi:hypothetical protein
MPEEEKGSPSFDLRTALLVGALIAGAYLIPTGLRSSRPVEKETLERTAIGDQIVPARLWQDPFEVTMTYQTTHRERIRNEAREPENARTNKAKVPIPPLHSLAELCKQIGRHGRTTQPVTILEVMISGGSYAEDAETRHRDRYAVLSALHVAGFVPWDAEHLGYAQTDWPRGQELEGKSFSRIPALRAVAKHPDSALIVPFEWLVTNSLTAVVAATNDLLVLWLNADAFDDHPLKRLAQLNHYLTEPTNYSDTPLPSINFKLLQPRVGSMLRELDEELKLHSADSSRHRDEFRLQEVLARLQIYSTWSTTPDPLLSPSAELPDRAALAKELGRLGCPGLTFCNATCTDDQLVGELLDELRLRRVDVTNPRDRIVLISEWDTDYGRALPLTFAAAVKCWSDAPDAPISPKRFADAVRKLKTDPHEWPTNLVLRTYLRGIDGQVPGEAAAKPPAGEAEPRAGQPANEAGQGEEAQRPEGHSQMDYLPRMAASLTALERELKAEHRGEFKAIGILGSDVYDKLLVLQSLRREFTDELFFTTDLDARMLHPDALKWTRNVLVASSFGLELATNFQREIPPFRDTYQTGQYLACLAAFGFPGVTAENLQHLAPRRYEIGRTAAFDLSTTGSVFQPFSPRPGFKETILNRQTLYWVLVALASALLAAFFVPLARASVRTLIHTFRAKPESLPIFDKRPWLFRLVIWLPMLAVGALCYVIVWDNGHQAGEPFSLTEGISSWPTELLRFLAACLTLFFAFKAHAELRKNRQDLEKELGFPAEESDEPVRVRTNPAPRNAGLLRPVRALRQAFKKISILECAGDKKGKDELYRNYSELAAFGRRKVRVCLSAAIYGLLIGLFYLLFDAPFQPTRGRLNQYCDDIVAVSNSALLVLLVFFVVDASRLCRRFIEHLSEAPREWPDSYTRLVDADGLHEAYKHEYIDLRVIAKRSDAVGQLIFYPFFILFVIIIARNSFFDRWDWPPTILLFLGLISAYAVYAVWSLRRAAEDARTVLLDRLNLKLLAQRNNIVAEQLRLMIRRVKACEEGAFAPITQQPVIKAGLMPFGGAGILALLNYLATKL